jgi:hypothetical protein
MAKVVATGFLRLVKTQVKDYAEQRLPNSLHSRTASASV